MYPVCVYQYTSTRERSFQVHGKVFFVFITSRIGVTVDLVGSGQEV